MAERKRWIAATLTAALLVMPLLSGCGTQDQEAYRAISGLDAKQEVSLKIAIPYETNKAMNTAANAFMEKYPNVNVQMQYIEDYDNNAVQLFKDNEIDMILQKDLFYEEYAVKDEETGEETLTGDNTDDYFYNFAADDEINFSDTTSEISDNYRHTRTDEEGNEIVYQYSLS
ncbi:MAG: hypothetical protein EOM18_13240, partial [Clostridia bacterium]|nr:hypothetical protein [Clostridia bacterium]